MQALFLQYLQWHLAFTANITEVLNKNCWVAFNGGDPPVFSGHFPIRVTGQYCVTLRHRLVHSDPINNLRHLIFSYFVHTWDCDTISGGILLETGFELIWTVEHDHTLYDINYITFIWRLDMVTNHLVAAFFDSCRMSHSLWFMNW